MCQKCSITFTDLSEMQLKLIVGTINIISITWKMRVLSTPLNSRHFVRASPRRRPLRLRRVMNGKTQAATVSQPPSKGRKMFQEDLTLAETDPEIAEIIQLEKARQVNTSLKDF